MRLAQGEIERQRLDDDTLVELCCTRSNIEIKRMKDAYARLFGRPLIQVVRSETSGAYRKLLVRVLLGLRDESPKTSRKSAEVQAAALNKAMSKWKVDRDAIIDLLTKCSAAQLAVVSDVYAETYGIDLEAAIDGSLSSVLSPDIKALGVETVGMTKRFGGFTALDDVSIKVAPGSCMLIQTGCCAT